MDELIFFLLNLIAEALGLKQKRAALPRVPPVPPAAAPAAGLPPRTLALATGLPPRTALMPNAPRTIARPPGDDQSLVPQQATAAGFAEREAQGMQFEAQGLAMRAANQALPTPAAPPASPLSSLFTSGDDLVRAFVMQEILQAPRALRPHRPLPSPSDPVQSAD